jgi:pimeloyl-ACP methyl ester carboxylesterase
METNPKYFQRSSRWNRSIANVAAAGYGGAAAEFPHFAENIDQAVDALHRALSPISFHPPVVVAHSMSTYIAQKYLESYALSGLILVNPVPPQPSKAIAKLLERWSYSRSRLGRSLTINELESAALQYYGMTVSIDSFHHKLNPLPFIAEDLRKTINTKIIFSNGADFQMPASLNLLRSLVDDESTVLTLEPRSVPMFIVMTCGDREIIGPQGETLLIQYHDVEEDGKVVFEQDESRLPMLTSPNNFNSLINSWIDLVA